MSLEFANVTDIAIPQGDVTKIAETATGVSRPFVIMDARVSRYWLLCFCR